MRFWFCLFVSFLTCAFCWSVFRSGIHKAVCVYFERDANLDLGVISSPEYLFMMIQQREEKYTK